MELKINEGNKQISFAFLGNVEVNPNVSFSEPTPTPTPTATPTATPTRTPTPSPTPTPCPVTVSITLAQRVYPGTGIFMQGNAFTCGSRGFQVSAYPDFQISGTVPVGGSSGSMSATYNWSQAFPAYVRAFSDGSFGRIYSGGIRVDN
jgi:hypothetical protein